MKYDVKNMSLAKKGALRIEWAKEYMPVMRSIEERFKKIVPLTVLVVAIFVAGLPFVKWIEFLINKVA